MPTSAFKLCGALVLAATSAGAACSIPSCAPLPSNDCSVLHECPIPDGADDGIGQDGGTGQDAEIDADAGVDQEIGEAGTAADASDASAKESSACDGTKPPHDDPCVIDELFGVFVSPVGADGNPGTRALPLYTLGQAIDAAHASGKQRVYACAGTFTEQLLVGISRDGVAVYGGLDCASWSYGAQNRVTVAPTKPGYALDVEGLVQGATFEDLALVAQSASGANAGESSIAVFVSGSQSVALHRVSISAGNAADGATGASGGLTLDGGAATAGTNWLGSPPYAELNGNDAIGAVGAAEKTCMCPDGTVSVGGQGGGSSDAGADAPGVGSPLYDTDAGLVGRNSAACGIGGAPAQNGSDAPSTMRGPPSQSWGSVVSTGWTAAASLPGANGMPAQGGGGGGNGPGGVGGGGGGACGGCGGAGGRQGSAGGSSIALLSYQSTIELVGCALAARSAGSGGAGGDGEFGQPGSLTAGNGAQSGCQGGLGGSGAGGNGGQGGAGGLSVGIGYTGTPPTFDGTPVAPAASLAGVTLGAAGSGGRKGAAGAAAVTSIGQPKPGAEGAPGFSGTAQAVLGF